MAEKKHAMLDNPLIRSHRKQLAKREAAKQDAQAAKQDAQSDNSESDGWYG